MNNVQSSWSEHKFSYGKMYRRASKIALTFEQSDGGTIHMFLCITHQGKCTLNRGTMYGADIANTNSLYRKMYRGAAKIASTFKQSDQGTIHMFHLYNLKPIFAFLIIQSNH